MDSLVGRNGFSDIFTFSSGCYGMVGFAHVLPKVEIKYEKFWRYLEHIYEYDMIGGIALLWNKLGIG